MLNILCINIRLSRHEHQKKRSAPKTAPVTCCRQKNEKKWHLFIDILIQINK